jgi:hypothetical protein
MLALLRTNPLLIKPCSKDFDTMFINLERVMTQIKQSAVLVLVAMLLTLGSPVQTPVSAAAQKKQDSPQTAPRFVVFEAFLNPG